MKLFLPNLSTVQSHSLQYTENCKYHVKIYNPRVSLVMLPKYIHMLHLHVIYLAPLQGLSLTAFDRSIYWHEEEFYFRNITGFLQHSFRNLRHFAFAYEAHLAKEVFNTRNIIVIEIYNRKYERDFTYLDNATCCNLSHVWFFVPPDGNVLVDELSGLTLYQLSSVLVDPNILKVELRLEKDKCMESCKLDAEMTIRQYLGHYYHTFRAKIFETNRWTNAQSKGSFELQVNVPEGCQSCSVSLFMNSLFVANYTEYDIRSPNR
jgi:hypothetical protein